MVTAGDPIETTIKALMSILSSGDIVIDGGNSNHKDTIRRAKALADAIDLDVPAPVITLSLIMRFVSRQEDSYAARMLAAMRQQFGGHTVKRST